MKYKIVNPSDPYTIEHDEFLALAMACVLLGNGQYALSPIDHDGEEVPLFLFGGFDKWWSAHSPSIDFVDYIKDNKIAIAEAMESVALTSEERTSLNDIGGRAKAWAEHLRHGESEGPNAPRQVFVG